MRALLVALTVALVATLTGAAPSSSLAAAGDGWRGSATVQPDAYAWLDAVTPDVDYDIVTVRGLTPRQVRRTLGRVEGRLSDMTPARAERWVARRLGRDYSAPCLALVDRRGPAVVVYLPMWTALGKLGALSRRGRVAHFLTTVEYDTYVSVAKRGKLVRRFDAGFRPPRRNALPEEAGLDWGAPDQNIWATAWAFDERVTGIHLSEDWFKGEHPAYRFRGSC